MNRISAQTHITHACGDTSKRYLRLGDFNDFKFGNCIFLVDFSENDQLCLAENSEVYEFDRGRIVAYRDCGLSFREIGSRVGRNLTTVMRICDRWMQEGTTDPRGLSHPPQCTTSLEDRQILRMAVMDRSVTS
ncbi:uncharacterized protein TNCV_1857971 [Trichonephila clavipes]|nr:uncharacterized protein TNCV_1857971 [Trichonephila clavipes]